MAQLSYLYMITGKNMVLTILTFLGKAMSLHFEAADVPVQMIFPLLLHFSQASNHLIFCHPFLLLPSIFPSIRLFSKKLALCIRWSSIGASNECSGVVSFRIDCPGDFQESSPAPQFKSINSSAFSLLYGPILISVHDYWRNYSFGYMDLCQQSDVSAF